LLAKQDRLWFDQILMDYEKVKEHLSHIAGFSEIIKNSSKNVTQIAPKPQTYHIPKELMNSYLSNFALAKFHELGPYKFPRPPAADSTKVENRPLRHFEDGVLYLGQFKVGTDICHGKGTMLYK
jgi:hypothetical protein